MATLAPAATVSVWQRLVARFTAFAEAAETDGFTYHDLRIASLERRIGALEGTAAATVATRPAGPRA